MSDDAPEQITVTLRAENAIIDPDGSERRPCEQCGETAIITPATVEAIETGTYPDYVVCIQCANELEEEAADE